MRVAAALESAPAALGRLDGCSLRVAMRRALTTLAAEQAESADIMLSAVAKAQAAEAACESELARKSATAGVATVQSAAGATAGKRTRGKGKKNLITDMGKKRPGVGMARVASALPVGQESSKEEGEEEGEGGEEGGEGGEGIDESF